MMQTELIPKEKRTAVFSECRRYRYVLKIVWDDSLPLIQWIGLNPSTADEFKDDPTLRRVKAFSKAWGFGGCVMTNLFAWRDTDPKKMKQETYPIGAHNDEHLIETNKACALTVAAWGVNGRHLNRDKWVIHLIPQMKCLRLTGEKCPEHPLYVPGATTLMDFN